MVLDKQRHRLDWWLVPLAKALRNVNPNVFTWFSLLAAVIGGWAFYAATPGDPSLLWLAWGMVLANSILDLLDGKVARLTNKMSPKGDYLDHAIDRFSDALFLGGIALGGWVDARIGLAAPSGQQVGVDTDFECDLAAADTRLARQHHCFTLELGAVLPSLRHEHSFGSV